MPRACAKSRSELRALKLSLLAFCLFSLPCHLFGENQVRGPAHKSALCRCALAPTKIWLKIDLKTQKLTLYQDQTAIKTYSISTSLLGSGELLHSYQTPKGLHEIDQKIGFGEPVFTIFKGRKSLKTRWSNTCSSSQDFILTRILTLNGLERGKNLGIDQSNLCVDTKQRHIYIHGTHQEDKIGQRASHGCIRMKNREIEDLFDKVPLGCHVFIE